MDDRCTITAISATLFSIALITGSLSGCHQMATTPKVSAQTSAAIKQVKRLLDARFTYVSDQEKWGQDLYWEQGHTGDSRFSGDCEEYADAAVYQLQKRGLDAEGWLVSTEHGELHMVACAQGWCIDNRRSHPFRQQTQPYRWLAGTSHY